MSALGTALFYGAVGGVAIPGGALLALCDPLPRGPLRREAVHAATAFGGGVLLAAVALVLVPHGMAALSVAPMSAAFGLGALGFLLLDRAVAAAGGRAGLLMSMVMDFVPEALALGAAYGSGAKSGPLLALLIALQNLPEGFSAYGELRSSRLRPGRALGLLAALALLGPLAAWLGFLYLRDWHAAVAAIMLFGAGGIVYLTFQDIAPEAHLPRRWAPALGAAAGFWVGMLGDHWLGA